MVVHQVTVIWQTNYLTQGVTTSRAEMSDTFSCTKCYIKPRWNGRHDICRRATASRGEMTVTLFHSQGVTAGTGEIPETIFRK